MARGPYEYIIYARNEPNVSQRWGAFRSHDRLWEQVSQLLPANTLHACFYYADSKAEAVKKAEWLWPQVYALFSQRV